ncbi:MAG: alpha/beta hydrolase [Actinobacteria bacterium]|nr:alpha/beta hydrolase [Actinomycetota bacterium]
MDTAVDVITHGGATIAVTTVGDSGPGILVVHGAMQAGESQRDLAELLAADGFRVHLMDRRGRGGSSALMPDTSPDDEVEDVRAVLAATGARRCVGVSSGALLAARCALAHPGLLDGVVLFEPPLAIDGSVRVSDAQRVRTAVRRGQLATAMAVGMRAAEMGPPWMFRLPIPVLAAFARLMLRRPGIAERAAALTADFAIVELNADRLSDFAAVGAPTLLIDGTETRPYLQKAVAELAHTIPGARHVRLEGLTHGATQNRDEYGRPGLVAPVMADFLA